MHEANAKRIGEMEDIDLDGLPDLPNDTHIVTGTLEGNGATEIASEKAKLSARVISLERTSSGGIRYQVAILAHEPAPAPTAVPEPQVTPFDEAVEFLVTERKMSETDAKIAVNKFTPTRVLAMRDKAREDELSSLVFGKKDDDKKDESAT